MNMARPNHAAFLPPMLVRPSITQPNATTRHRQRLFSSRKPRHHALRAPNALRMQAADQMPASPTPLAPRTSEVWELDFYSRPVVGLDGKKLWELIITDSTGTFEYIEAVPNSLVNSRELRKRIQAAIDSSSVKPTVIRFFRNQMYNMIQIALSDINVNVAPSRKTYALYRLLKYREENVYTEMPGFKATLLGQGAAFTGLDFKLSKRLPDALRCEKFSFGNFPLGQLQEFFDTADPSDFFGDSCYVDAGVAPETLVPGMIIFTKRAKALSAWISGIELAFVRTTMEKQEVVFECGINTVYRFAQITDDLRADVRSFQGLKNKSTGLHFLAVQESPESEEIEGMWLMNES